MLNNENKNLKVVCIIQARMNSKRLPGKVMPAFDKPLIQHMIERVKKSKLVSEFWLAIPDSKDDECLKEICKKTKKFCYADHNTMFCQDFSKLA